MDKSQQLAAQAIGRVLEGHNLTQALDQVWRQNAQLTPQQRAMTQDFSYGALRHYGQLQAVLGELIQKPLEDEGIRCLLLAALYQLEYSKASAYAVVDHAVKAAQRMKKPWAKGLVNAVLRNFLRRRETLLDAARQTESGRYSYPQWWIDKLKRDYPDAWEAVLETGNGHPPMTLRVNRRRSSANDYLARLQAVGLPGRILGEDAILLQQPASVEKLPGFAEGDVSVQDYGAQFAAGYLDLQDGQRVLDACCAPGGKTGHALEMAQVKMTAIDSEEVRLARVRSNLERLGFKANLVAGDSGDPDAWWDGQPFDRILADVPCSASGIVRRHVDIKWLRRESDISSFTRQQTRILRGLWRTLANGGKLLYVTCSIFPEENQRQIDAFLAEQADARQLPLKGLRDGQLLPCADHDGFFYALLQKT